MSDQSRPGILNTGNDVARWNGGPVDHVHSEAKRAGGGNFGNRRITASVLGEHYVDAVFPEQGNIIVCCERPTCRDDRRMRNAQRLGQRINHPDHVVVLGCGPQRVERQPSETRKNPNGQLRECCDRLLNIGMMLPLVTGTSDPRRPFESDQRYAGYGASRDRVGADLGCERVRGVEDNVDAAIDQIRRQAFCTAKSATANWNRCRNRIRRAACKRQRGVEPRITCKARRHTAGFAGAAKHQDARSGEISRSHGQRQ